MPTVQGTPGARLDTVQAQGVNGTEATPIFRVALASEAGMTVTTTEASIDLGVGGVLAADLVVTAATGTAPASACIIQTSSDNGVADAWATSHTFTSATGATAENKTAIVKRYVRAKSTITGTAPSFDLKITGEIAR